MMSDREDESCRACGWVHILTEELDSEDIPPQNMKTEKELMVMTEAGLGELGLASRLTSHRIRPVCPSSITT